MVIKLTKIQAQTLLNGMYYYRESGHEDGAWLTKNGTRKTINEIRQKVFDGQLVENGYSKKKGGKNGKT